MFEQRKKFKICDACTQHSESINTNQYPHKAVRWFSLFCFFAQCFLFFEPVRPVTGSFTATVESLFLFLLCPFFSFIPCLSWAEVPDEVLLSAVWLDERFRFFTVCCLSAAAAGPTAVTLRRFLSSTEQKSSTNTLLYLTFLLSVCLSNHHVVV